jgi:putative addiction module killer protein
MEVLRYVTESGVDVLGAWLTELRDKRAKARIAARITRLAVGNFGDAKTLRGGILELRIDYGPGYRVYFAMIARQRVLLLCGGDKRRQSADIDRAIGYRNDYRRRTGEQ